MQSSAKYTMFAVKNIYSSLRQQLRSFRTACKCHDKQVPRSSPIRPIGRISNWGQAGFMLIIPVTSFCLGTWQIKRREQKLEMIKLLEEKTTAPPVPLPQTRKEVEELEYRKVKVRGRFDYSKEMVIGPRHNIIAKLGTEGNMQATSTIGGYIVVPFILSDSNRTILVNRGYVPKRLIPAEKRPEGQIEGEIELVGVVRKNEQRNVFMSKSATDPTKYGYWMYRDIDLMAEIANTEPIFIDAVYESTIPGGPIGGQTKVQLRNEHLSYIFTWYTLSFLTFWMWKKTYYNKAIPDRAMDYISRMKAK
ncbi:surfeit locus protein 1 [Patella vulgata]|uniref:surfeit locus protein 1 n=1 Tax=Patella vulgata TaxID=6465 RepID=UPI0021807922|nr:surfeit locus protein 1 [Patella vulgata]